LQEAERTLHSHRHGNARCNTDTKLREMMQPTETGREETWVWCPTGKFSVTEVDREFGGMGLCPISSI
jgi:hypothetical protein